MSMSMHRVRPNPSWNSRVSPNSTAAAPTTRPEGMIHICIYQHTYIYMSMSMHRVNPNPSGGTPQPPPPLPDRQPPTTAPPRMVTGNVLRGRYARNEIS